MSKDRLPTVQKRISQGLKGKLIRLRPSSGFTLIESLVAMIVVSITLVAIVPPIFWATGTRVQNRRAEQALSIAQGEIDRVRSVLERDNNPLSTDLPPQVSKADFAAYRGPNPKAAWTGKIRSTDPAKNTAETSVVGTPFLGFPTSADVYLPVDTNGDGVADFLVQSFRDPGICVVTPCGTEMPRVFSMKVRVYSATAVNSELAFLQTDRASLTGTTGTGQTKNRPLAVLSSQIARSVSSGSLDQRRDSQIAP